MKGLKKRKVHDLSVFGPASKKFKVRRSNLALDSTKTTHSLRLNGSLNKLKVVLDRSIVHNYLDSKDFSRSRLQLNSDKTSNTLRHDEHIQKNGSCENNLEQSISEDCVESQKSCSRLPDDAFVKVEPFDYVDDDLCSNDSFFDDSIFIKRDESDEEIDIVNVSDKEDNLIDVDQKIRTEQQLTEKQVLSSSALFSNSCDHSDNTDINVGNNNELHTTVELAKTEAPAAALISNGSDNTDDGINVKKDLKSKDFVLSNSNKRETKNENQSNEINVKEPIANGTNYYFCDNCKYKTTSKLCLYRHIRDNYTNKDAFMPCSKCNKKFRTENVLKYHEKKCGTKLYFTCKFCPKITVSRAFLRRHIISQHPEDFKIDDLDDIMKEITKARERRNVKEMAEVLKDIPVKNRKIKTNLDRKKVIKMYCSTCNVISERGRAVIAMGCSKCDTTLMFQCQMCGKNYDKISGMRAHIKWSCKNAEAKLKGDTTAVSQFVLEKNIIVYSKPNNLSTDEQSLPEDKSQTSNNCKQCKKTKGKQKTKVCKHVEYKPTGCRFEKDNAVCLKCNEEFPTIRRFAEHKIFCGVKILYPCPFCTFTYSNTGEAKRHITTVHDRKFDIEKLQDVINGMINERNKVKEKYISDHHLDLKHLTTRLMISKGLDPAYKRLCTACGAYRNVKKDNKFSKFCPKCNTVIKHECQRCNKRLVDSQAAYAHSNTVTSLCKSIRNSQS